MHRLLCLGCCLAVILTVSQAGAEPTQRRGFHPFKAVAAKWRKERALRQLEQVVRAKPRVAVKFRERYGKLGGRAQFGTRSDWTLMTMGTAINVGGVVDPEHVLHYLAASTLVGLGTVAKHVFTMKRKRRAAIISMIEDGTISNTDLKPFRKALGLRENGRRLTPRPEAPPEQPPEPPAQPAPRQSAPQR